LNVILISGTDTLTLVIDLLQRVGCISFEVLAEASPPYFSVCHGEDVEINLSMIFSEPAKQCGIDIIFPRYSYYNVSTVRKQALLLPQIPPWSLLRACQ
jgi:hypothetical protein